MQLTAHKDTIVIIYKSEKSLILSVQRFSPHVKFLPVV